MANFLTHAINSSEVNEDLPISKTKVTTIFYNKYLTFFWGALFG